MLPVVGGSFARFLAHPSAIKWVLGGFTLFGLASYAWRTWRESTRLRDLYGDRLIELLDSTYHAITFADKDEAAAFVAALGRQLHSPREDLATYDEDVEIAATSGADGTTLFLSDGAMRAFTTAFAAPTTTRPVVGRDLPPERVPLLVGAPSEPTGRDDVLKLLTK